MIENEQAVPEQESDKKQGDKLDHAVDSALDKVTGGGTGLTQDTSHKGSQPTPQDAPLK